MARRSRFVKQAAVGGMPVDVAVTDEVADIVGRGVQRLRAPSEAWLALGGRRAWLDVDLPLRPIVHKMLVRCGFTVDYATPRRRVDGHT